MALSKLHSYQKLLKLSKHPLDLTKEGVLSPERISKCIASNAGLKLLFGTQRIDEEVLETLFLLAEEAKAVDHMKEMQSGKVINKIEGFESENRQVLHTAMRDFFENKNTSREAKEAADLAWAEVEKLKEFTKEIEQEGCYTDVVQVGIGGSDLGPRAIYIALKAYQTGTIRTHFISNVDPDDAASILNELDLSKTLVVVVSKSGSTLETRTNEQFFREKYEGAGIDATKHIIAVTGKGSPMDDPSKYRASFYIWDYIGGRYSVTSMVGGVTLALSLGIDIYLEFLKGASQIDKIALEEDPYKNLPLLAALIGIWNRNFLGLPTCAIIPYSNAMLRFTAHLQQCDMESNGKHITKDGKRVDFETGPIIWGEPGTNGQHSFYQLIHQGTNIIPLEFIGFKHSQFQVDVEVEGTTSQEKLLSNLFAQSIGLATGKHNDNPNKVFEGNRPNSVLLADKCDAQTVGKLLSFYEHKVAFQGFIWGVNSFDQEGVQLGKVLANQIIDMFAKKRKGEKITSSDFPLGQALINQL